LFLKSSLLFRLEKKNQVVKKNMYNNSREIVYNDLFI
jgi:hypothetical protein